MNAMDRRRWLQWTGLQSMGIGGLSMSGWLPALADQIAADPARRRHCILLWMSGGPSQIDTFDMKPNHENGGEFREIETNVPGVRFSEHLPKLSLHADKLAIVRGLSTKEGDHGRATHVMHTGHRPMGPLRYPAVGASLGKALGSDADPLPHYVSVGTYRAFDQTAFEAGFLGPRYAPLFVGASDAPTAPTASAEGFAELKIDSLQSMPGITAAQTEKRLAMWRLLQTQFVAEHPGSAARAQETVYQRTLQLMNSGAAGAFDLSEEPSTVREAYGKSLFGQGCLMARRLIERGVPFVEVALSGMSGGGAGWDTHSDNFSAVKELSQTLDSGWAALLDDLQQRGLLESTTILWMGEFGRTPRINGNAGRDHFPKAWTCVLGGGGIAGGQAHGKTSDDGMEVVDGEVSVENVLATLCQAVGVNPKTTNQADTGRPIAIVDGEPISTILS